MTIQPTTPQNLPQDGFTRLMPLARLLGIHHQTLRRWVKAGKFPKPQTLNGVMLFNNAEVVAFTQQSA